MNKKIIAIALAGAFVTPLAMADVTIYGFISSGVESIAANGTANAAPTGLSGPSLAAVNAGYALNNGSIPTRNRVADENSRIGFKGTEDLGNGLNSVWQVENSLRDMAGGGTNDKGQTAAFATRNTFVGLKDNTFGQIILGYNDSAYKRYTNVGANVMADTSADTMGSSSGLTDIASRGDDRLANSVHYDSPSWNGLQFGASYGFDEANVSNTTSTPDGNSPQADVAASYTQGGLKIGIGYDYRADSGYKSVTAASLATPYAYNGTTKPNGQNAGVVLGQATSLTTHIDASTSFAKAAVSYLFAGTGTLLAVSYEHASYGDVGESEALTQNDWTVAAVQNIGDNAAIKLSYNKLGNLGSIQQTSAHQWVLGGTYNLSKRTQLLAFATRINNDQFQDVNFGVNPIYTTNLGTTSYGALAAGNTLSAIGAGIKFSF
jgi:predicted porin